MGGLWLVVRAPLSEAAHTWLEVGLVLLLWKLLLGWLKENEIAMMMEDRQKNPRPARPDEQNSSDPRPQSGLPQPARTSPQEARRPALPRLTTLVSFLNSLIHRLF
jgi:hypothetical protein